MFLFSVFDIASDILLFITFLEVATVIKIVPMESYKSNNLLNTTARTCTFIELNEDGYKFSCEEYNPMFASLTLLCIYFPSLNFLATLLGPWTAAESLK